MTLFLSLLAAPFAFVVFVALAWRRRALMWEAKANHWLAQSNEHEKDADYYRSLLGWLGKGPVKAPRHAYPTDLLMGTRSAPVLSPLGHPAYASTVDDLLVDCGLSDDERGEA